MAHSIAESTNIFLPNTGGMYFGLYFILPVINVLQSKKYKEIKEETTALQLNKESVSKSAIVFSLLIIAIMAIFTKIIANLLRLDLFLMLVTFLAQVTLCIFVLALTNNKIVNAVNNNLTAHYIRRVKEEKPYEN
jgi:hypothetical protein